MRKTKFRNHTEKFFKNPIVITIGWIGGVCGIIAIPLSIFLASEKPELTYYYSKDESVSIISKNDISGLHVYHDNIIGEIKEEITISKIKIWNAGKSTIQTKDVRRPIKIISVPKVKIVGARTLNIKSESVFQLSTIEQLNGKIGVDFSILEEREGDIIQIAYIGDQDVKFELKGKIIGQKVIKHWELPTANYITWVFFISSVIFILSAIIAIFTGLYLGIKKDSQKAKIIRDLIPKVMNPSIIVSFGCGLYLVIISRILSKWIEPF